MYIYIYTSKPADLHFWRSTRKNKAKISNENQESIEFLACTYPFYTMIFVTSSFTNRTVFSPFPRAGLIRHTLRSEPGSGQATFLPAQAHHLPAAVDEVQVGRFETMEWNLVPLRGGRGQNTLPETNITPENGWLEYYLRFGSRPILRGELLVLGRLIPQLTVYHLYTTYSPCLLGGLYNNAYHLLGEPETTIEVGLGWIYWGYNNYNLG